MAKVSIDGIDYDTESLSEKAREKLMMAQFCDRKIVDLKAELIIAQVARNTVVEQLKALAGVETNGRSADSAAKQATKAGAQASGNIPEEKPKPARKRSGKALSPMIES